MITGKEDFKEPVYRLFENMLHSVLTFFFFILIKRFNLAMFFFLLHNCNKSYKMIQIIYFCLDVNSSCGFLSK